MKGIFTQIFFYIYIKKKQYKLIKNIFNFLRNKMSFLIIPIDTYIFNFRVYGYKLHITFVNLYPP